VYLLNTLGGAAGILIAGFLLVPTFGLPGTTIAAGLLNLTAAALVWPRAHAHLALDDRAAISETPLEAEASGRALLPLLLAATLLSALASEAAGGRDYSAAVAVL
jgi:predicted membrane-bound spermidine synthase